MSNNKQLYVFANDGYYMIDDCRNLIVPNNVDFTSNSRIIADINSNLHTCNISGFFYHNDLITNCNSERTCYMKEYLLMENITEMHKLNNDFVLSVDYTIYNKYGEVISARVSYVKAKYCKALLMSDVNSENILEYREGFVFDGNIEAPIPRISRYGIKTKYIQHPYTIKINKIGVITTIGDYRYIRESDSQVNTDTHHHASNAQYCIHNHQHFMCNNFSSHFLTNAKTGNTIIDHIVAPAELQIPPEYTEVVLCEIDCGDSNTTTVVVKDALDDITFNLEVLLDNFNVVHDSNDINAIIEYNNNPTEPEEPDIDEPTPDEPDNPDTPTDEPTNDSTNNENPDDIKDPVVDNPTTDEPTDNTTTTEPTEEPVEPVV